MAVRGGLVLVFVVLLTFLAGSEPAHGLTREQTEEIQLFILGNTVFTLHHELGHALIDRLDLPVLGREEDAVDHLATIMMLPVQADPVMDRMIVAAADGWAFSNARRAAEGNGTPVWWGEHSLDMQRFYAVVCLMYGSDPARFGALADKVELPVERRQSCPDDYARAADGWARLLQPHLVPDDRRGDSLIPVTYGNSGAEFAHLADLVRSSGLMEAIARDIGTSFALPGELPVAFERCGQANALYDRGKPGVILCYELIDFFDKLIRDDIGRR